MTIGAYRLPDLVEQGCEFGPSFDTVIQESISGVEQRYSKWTHCRGVGDLSIAISKSDDPVGDFQAIVALYRAHFGRLYPFRFKDWADYQATDELIGNGNGTTKDFQLVKTYDPSQIILGTPGSLFYVRTISLPILSTVVIKVDGVTKTLTTDYTISTSGLVSFVSAPASSTDITWTGEFDIPVRFDTDTLPVIVQTSDLASIRSLPIKEVIGES